MAISWQMDRFWYIHTMEERSVAKRNRLPIQATTRVSFKSVLLSERSQIEKAAYGLIPCI